MNKEEETLPMSAVETMVDIQYRNLTSSTKMVAESDLGYVRRKLLAVKDLLGARKLLRQHMREFRNIGAKHVWVEEATGIISEVIRELKGDLESEEQRLTKKIAGLDKEIKDYDLKMKERKKKQ